MQETCRRLLEQPFRAQKSIQHQTSISEKNQDEAGGRQEGTQDGVQTSSRARCTALPTPRASEPDSRRPAPVCGGREGMGPADRGNALLRSSAPSQLVRHPLEVVRLELGQLRDALELHIAPEDLRTSEAAGAGQVTCAEWSVNEEGARGRGGRQQRRRDPAAQRPGVAREANEREGPLPRPRALSMKGMASLAVMAPS